MASGQLEQRVAALEETVADLKARLDLPSPWWLEQAGRFADDPVFDEIVRLGAEYRRSLRPAEDEAADDRP